MRLFKPTFAPLVRTGAKAQTVRPTPKRMPRPGDIFDGREWTGRPYASKQRKLIEAPIWKVSHTVVVPSGIVLAGHTLTLADAFSFAKADGFNTLQDMLDWFTFEHGLPFEGITIYWTPPLGGGVRSTATEDSRRHEGRAQNVRVSDSPGETST